MKLTKMADGRYLLEHDSGVVLPLTVAELDGLMVRGAHRLTVERVTSSGSGVGLEVSTEFSGRAVLHLCFSNEAVATAQAVLNAAMWPADEYHVTRKDGTPE
jgi:hypothetical protein